MRGQVARGIWAYGSFGRLSGSQPSAWIWAWSWDPLRFMRRHPPHHLSPARANHPAGQDPEAASAAPSHHSNAPIRQESQSILSKIVAPNCANRGARVQDATLRFCADFRHSFLGILSLCAFVRLIGDFWRPVSASKNSVPGGRAFSVGPTALAPVFPTFGPPQFAIFGRRCNYSELSPSASTAARAALDVQHALRHDYDLLTARYSRQLCGQSVSRSCGTVAAGRISPGPSNLIRQASALHRLTPCGKWLQVRPVLRRPVEPGTLFGHRICWPT